MALTGGQKTKLAEIKAALEIVQFSYQAVRDLINKIIILDTDLDFTLTQDQVTQLIAAYTAKRATLISAANDIPAV